MTLSALALLDASADGADAADDGADLKVVTLAATDFYEHGCYMGCKQWFKSSGSNVIDPFPGGDER